MKKLSLLVLFVLTVVLFSSCGSSPYKKRKGCRGNGGWYGKRNLGAIDQSPTKIQPTYAWTEVQE